MARHHSTADTIYREIAANDIARLNWRAMCYFIKRRLFDLAAQCRDRVGDFNDDGPLAGPDWKAPVPELKGSFPVVLYFAIEAERDEFINAVKLAKPGLVTKPL